MSVEEFHARDVRADTIQVDVKYVQIAGRWAFQYTALDDCTRVSCRSIGGCIIA